jgi:uncharacterized OB-fold protein
MAKEKKPIVEGLFTWPSDDPRLIASKCKKCGTVAFPKAPFCTNPDCEKVRENVCEIQLDKRGKVFTYTYQIYTAPPPFRMEPFEPYGIAMVDLPEGIRLLGIIPKAKDLEIGMNVEVGVTKLYEDEENEYITYAFKPVS